MSLPVLFGGVVSSTTTYTKEIINPSVYASESVYTPITETLEQKIDRIALANKIDPRTLYNLAESESQLGEQRIGDKGKSCGIIHFHQDYYPEEFSKCADDEYILNRAAEMIANGEDWKFTPCSCVQFAKARGVKIKGNANDIFPTSTAIPTVGGVVILKYWNPDRHHVAVIEEVTETGLNIIEGNFERCKITRRFIPFESKNIMGYYKYQE